MLRKNIAKIIMPMQGKFIIFLIVIAAGFRIFFAFGDYHPDLGNHLDWGVKFWEVGPKYFYENLFWKVSWANQPPGTMYFFAGLRKVYEVFFSVFWWLNLNISVFPSGIIPFVEEKLYIALVKLPAILADFGIAYLIYRFVTEFKSKKLGQIAAFVFLFNPVVWYNSTVWGQTDATINFFVIFSFFLLWKNKYFFSVLSFFASFYLKGSLIIFFPVFLIYFWKSKLVWWKKIIYLIIQPVIFSYLSWPFVRWMSPLPWMYHLYKDRIFGHQGNMLTANAFNLWAFFFGIDFSKDDLGIFLNFTYKRWGMLITGILIIPVFVKLLVKKFDIKILFGSLVTIAFACFLFMTNMHERYLYPAIPYLTILIFLIPKLKISYLFLSLIFILNLYHLWFVPGIIWLKALYTPDLIKIFSLLNIFIFIYYYFRNFWTKRV